MPPASLGADRAEFALFVAAVREALKDVPPRNGYSVADLCTRWKIGADKVNGFIRRGELVAVNVATNTTARPQWRITPEEVARFEAKRTSAPTPKVPRRRRKTGPV